MLASLLRHRDALAALTLALLPFVVLGHALVPGKVMSPADNVFALRPWRGVHPGVSGTNSLLVDITLMFHPFAIYGADEIRAGRFPLWNPHTFGGAPFFANPQTALLFPLTALVYVLPHALALTLMSVLKLSAAGVGMYWFLRQLALRRWAAFIAALTFAFSALLVVWLQWSYGSAVALLPALFAVTELVRARPGARPVAALALAVALALFAGYPQRVVFWLFLLGIWALYRARTTPEPRRFARRWTVGVALGVMLAAVQLLPFTEYVRSSAVLAYRTEWMLYYPLPFRALSAVLMPHFFGSPIGKDFWGPVNFNELAVAVGVVPWLVMPVAAIAAWSRAGTKYFVALTTLSAALVYGVPVVGWALATLPMLNTSIAVRNADLFVFSLAVLAGIGLDAVTKLGSARRAASIGVRVAFTAVMLAALGFVAAYGAIAALRPRSFPLWQQYLWLLLLSTVATLVILRLIAGSETRPRAWLALGAVQLAGLLPLAVTYNPVVDARLLDYQPPPVAKYLQARTAADGGRALFSGIGAANLGTIFGLFEFGGYDGMTPRYVEQLVDPRGSLESYASSPMRVTVDAASAVADVLGIRYVVLPPEATSPGPHFALDYRGADAVVYRNERALPRAFIVHRTRTCLDDAAALALIRKGDVDLRHEVVIAGCHDVPAPGAASGTSRATIETSAADRVVITTITDSAGYLVLSDAWFPGWRAWIDDVEHTVWRANHALRAVSVPAGRHVVEFRYVPSPFRWGLVLTVLAGVIVLGLLWAPRWRVGYLAAVLIVGAPTAVQASLATAPLDLDVTPAVVTDGERVVITLRPVDPSRVSGDVEPYDIYLSLSAPVGFESDTQRGWLFMTSSGRISAAPAPFRAMLASIPAEGFTAILNSLPPGWHLIRAQFVKSAAPEPGRKFYSYEPRWVTIRVDPRHSNGSRVTVAALAAATLLAAVVVWLPTCWWRAGAQ